LNLAQSSTQPTSAWRMLGMLRHETISSAIIRRVIHFPSGHRVLLLYAAFMRKRLRPYRIHMRRRS
jgi:hypothetical protein